MNAGKRLNPIVVTLLVLAAAGAARAESVRQMVRQGNRLYADGQYAEAVNRYNEAEVEQPEALVPKFNKANSYYRLDDLGEAIDLYQEVAAGSKDMTLVTKAKYNLGNCFFQRGDKQRDSDLHKALEDMQTSITYWRGVLDIDPQNEKAARNIEVARLTIKDILDQIKKQQEQQKQEQQQQDQQGQPPNQDQQQGQQPRSQDPNQPQEQQPQGAEQKQDPNQTEQQKQQDQQQQDQGQEPQQAQQQQVVPDATAQEILDKEQRQKEQRQILQRAATQKVEKDW